MNTESSTSSTTGPATGAGRRIGPVLLWFGVLGGPVAWAFHLMAAWLLVELGCAHGTDTVGGVGLRVVTAVAVAVPGLVALAALLVALTAVRRLPSDEPDRRTARAHFMSVVGAGMDALSLAMIIFGGAAVATLTECGR